MSKSTIIKLQNSLETLIDTKEDKVIYYGGILGTYDSLGNEIVDVPGRSNFSFVRLNGSLGEVIEAFNITVAAEFGLKVKVAKKPGEFFYEVIGLDLAQYSSWGDGGSNPFLPKHAFTHSFGAGTNVGTDPVFIYKRQLLQPLGMQPVGTGTAFYGYVNPDFYIWNSNIEYFEGAYTANFSALKPTNSQSRYVTVYLDGNTGNLAYKTGTLFTPTSSVSAMIANIPEVNLVTEGFPLQAIYLASGTRSVGWDNMFDIRNFLNAGGNTLFTGTVSSGAGFPTGIPNDVVLFGKTGTVGWDANKFLFLDASDQLLLGTSSLPFGTATKFTIVMTGANAGVALIGYGQNGGALFGRAVNGTQANPSGTQANLRLLNLEGSGYENSEGYTTFRAALRNISETNWVSGSTPAYWEMWATPTGSNIAEVVGRWYGGRQDIYKPLFLEDLRFGTGAIYSSFIKSAGQTVVIPYVLPPNQGVANSVLTNDGLGNLSWVVISVTGSGGEIMGGYPTGIPDNVILYGRTGTIAWDINKFLFMETRNQVLIGSSGVIGSYPDANIQVVATGTTNPTLHLTSYSSAGLSAQLAGSLVGGGPSAPSATPGRKEIVKLVGGGHDGSSYVSSAAELAILSKYVWQTGDRATYLQFKVTPTGTTTQNITERIYGNFEEHYFPVHLDLLRFGTGTYTQFSGPTGSAANILYKLPEAQGAVNTFLKNDGSGNLSWAIPSVTGGTSTAAGYPTGVPDNVVLFGKTGTISWDATRFVFLDSTDQLLVGVDSTDTPISNTAGILVYKTGMVARFVAESLGSNGEFAGYSIGAASGSKTATPIHNYLVKLIGGGFTDDYVVGGTFSARADQTFSPGTFGTYWELKTVPIGDSTETIVGRWHGLYQEIFKPLKLASYLQFGTGSIYTQFNQHPAQGGAISYILPTGQGGVNTFLNNDGSGNLSWVSSSAQTSVTGIPNGAVLFGQTGIIGWDAPNLYYNDTINQLVVGHNATVPAGQTDRFIAVNTGVIGPASFKGLNFGNKGGAFKGQAVGGDVSGPSGTQLGFNLVSLEGYGHDSSSYTGLRSKIVSIAKYNWVNGDNPTYWQIESTPTGTNLTNIVQRIYGEKEEHYYPVHLSTLRFGTGTYTEFIGPTGSASNINYKLPEVQGGNTTVLSNDGSGNLRWSVLSTGSYPTGIPATSVLFGKAGTIGWGISPTRFTFDDTDKVLGLDFTTNGIGSFGSNPSIVIGRETLSPEIKLFGYDFPASFKGARIGGSTASPAATTAGPILGLFADGYVAGVVPSGGAFTANAPTVWAANSTPVYWEIKATPTGSATMNVVNRAYGNFEEHYQPVHLDKLRFGTGAIYTEFSKSASQSAIVSYVLPTGQGSANTVLINNGSGGLSWGVSTGTSVIIYLTGAGGYPTGIPNDVVLFGGTGTIQWDASKFVWLNNTDQLILGAASLPFTTSGKLLISQTGTTAKIDLVGYGSDGGDILGLAAGGTPASPSVTTGGKKLISIRSGGYLTGSNFVENQAQLMAITNYTWNNSDTPAYWSIRATPTGTTTINEVVSLYGNYEIHYQPAHFDILRIGTGSVYTEFKNSTSQTAKLPYVLPTGQLSYQTWLRNDGAGNLDWGEENASITFIVDGGGSVITTGTKGDLEIPFGCVIQRVTMLADQTGTIVFDIWKDSYANYPPTSSDSIVASAPPKIATGMKGQDLTLSGWTTIIAPGDTLRYQVNNVASITRTTISLKVRKT